MQPWHASQGVEQPTHKLSVCRPYTDLLSRVHSNEQTDHLAENVPTHSVLRLDKMDISKSVMDKFYRDEELEWQNNPTSTKRRTSIHNQRRHFTLATETGS